MNVRKLILGATAAVSLALGGVAAAPPQEAQAWDPYIVVSHVSSDDPSNDRVIRPYKTCDTDAYTYLAYLHDGQRGTFYQGSPTLNDTGCLRVAVDWPGTKSYRVAEAGSGVWSGCRVVSGSTVSNPPDSWAEAKYKTYPNSTCAY